MLTVMFSLLTVLAAPAGMDCVVAAAGPPAPPYELRAYKPLGIWTDRNVERRRAIDLRGTDLGVSFPIVRADGRRELVFLFGDTHHFGEDRTGRFDEDSIAGAPIDWRDRTRLPTLDWLTRPDGEWLSLLVPGEDLRGMEVPLDGIQIGQRVVLFFNADYDHKAHRHRSLVCAVAPAARFDRLEKRFKQKSDKFLNVSVSADPADPATIWIFGTGHYRRSPIYLAKAPAATLEDYATWQFRAGDAWANDEETATPIVEGRMGELSARFVPAAKSWVLLYQRRLRTGQRGQGVFARFASAPTGPWSDELPLLEPDARAGIGFGEFMHGHTWAVGFCDGLANPGRENQWGDPYGPYLVPEWCYVDGEQLHLVHTLSSWNPYQSYLMETVLISRRAAASHATPATAPATRPAFSDLRRVPLPDRLKSTGQPMPLRSIQDKDWLWMTSAAGQQTARWKVGDGQRWLTFRLRGPGLIARLSDGSGHVVRESRSSVAEAGELEVRWRVDPFVGQTVTFGLDARPSDAQGGGFTPPVLLTVP